MFYQGRQIHRLLLLVDGADHALLAACRLCVRCTIALARRPAVKRPGAREAQLMACSMTDREACLKSAKQRWKLFDFYALE